MRHHIRLWHGFFPYHINICGNGRERRGTICAGSNRCGEVARDRFNGEHRAGDGFAAHGVALDDLHIGQFVVFSGHGVLFVPVRGVHIDANGRGVCTVPRGRFGFHEGPQSFGDVLYLDHTAIFRHIAADDLTVTVNQEAGAIQSACCSRGDLL